LRGLSINANAFTTASQQHGQRINSAIMTGQARFFTDQAIDFTPNKAPPPDTTSLAYICSQFLERLF